MGAIFEMTRRVEDPKHPQHIFAMFKPMDHKMFNASMPLYTEDMDGATFTAALSKSTDDMVKKAKVFFDKEFDSDDTVTELMKEGNCNIKPYTDGLQGVKGKGESPWWEAPDPNPNNEIDRLGINHGETLLMRARPKDAKAILVAPEETTDVTALKKLLKEAVDFAHIWPR